MIKPRNLIWVSTSISRHKNSLMCLTRVHEKLTKTLKDVKQPFCSAVWLSKSEAIIQALHKQIRYIIELVWHLL